MFERIRAWSRASLRVLAGLAFVLWLAGAASAQGPQPQHADPYWQASYWDNKYLRGTPAYQRSESSIDYDWSGGAPVPFVESDEFSVRWTRYVDFPAGTYHFTATCDDGMRVYIDGALVLNEWIDHPATTHYFSRYMGAGHHLIVVEYYENAYAAVAKFSWSPTTPTPSINYWRGEYYNNTSLSGEPSLIRDDVAVNFHWNEASPATDVIKSDYFSVRWTRNLDLPAGVWRFTLTLDDGARLWVNNQLVLDDWSNMWVHTHTVDVSLPGGSVPVKLEYYENTGGASAELSWSSLTAIANWRGEYYNNMWLSGAPALVRDDAAVNFDWGWASPAPDVITSDNFSVRWTRNLDLPAGSYRFRVTSDDGARLWVNNHLLIDAWKDQSPQTYSGDIYLPSGSVTVKLEYYEHSRGAVVRLSWERLDGGTPFEVIVDDGDEGFAPGGSASDWRSVSRGFDGDAFWTYNNDRIRTGYNWARWYPDLTAGRYEVFAHIPNGLGTTARARYWVSHEGGLTLRLVNQNAAVSRWESLGTYDFRGTHNDYVSLADVTGETRLSRRVVYDAIKWELR